MSIASIEPTNLARGLPRWVWVRGGILDADKNAIAIVGTRHPTREQETVAWDFAHTLAKNGVTIVSGMAIGIDTVAHKAALNAHGRTIAVLGTGFNNIYPKRNVALACEIEKSGAVVSPFPPEIGVERKNFLVRNEVIVALSRAVLIIAGDRRSGTLNTARHSANAGKEVFCVPGSPATDWLIGEGATPVSSPGQVLDTIDKL